MHWTGPFRHLWRLRSFLPGGISLGKTGKNESSQEEKRLSFSIRSIFCGKVHRKTPSAWNFPAEGAFSEEQGKEYLKENMAEHMAQHGVGKTMVLVEPAEEDTADSI